MYLLYIERFFFIVDYILFTKPFVKNIFLFLFFVLLEENISTIFSFKNSSLNLEKKKTYGFNNKKKISKIFKRLKKLEKVIKKQKKKYKKQKEINTITLGILRKIHQNSQFIEKKNKEDCRLVSINERGELCVKDKYCEKIIGRPLIFDYSSPNKSFDIYGITKFCYTASKVKLINQAEQISQGDNGYFFNVGLSLNPHSPKISFQEDSKNYRVPMMCDNMVVYNAQKGSMMTRSGIPILTVTADTSGGKITKLWAGAHSFDLNNVVTATLDGSNNIATLKTEGSNPLTPNGGGGGGNVTAVLDTNGNKIIGFTSGSVSIDVTNLVTAELIKPDVNQATQYIKALKVDGIALLESPVSASVTQTYTGSTTYNITSLKAYPNITSPSSGSLIVNSIDSPVGCTFVEEKSDNGVVINAFNIYSLKASPMHTTLPTTNPTINSLDNITTAIHAEANGYKAYNLKENNKRDVIQWY